MRPSNDWELWETDPVMGRKVYARHDGTRWHLKTVYDAEAILQKNAAERSATRGERMTQHGHWRKIASIPANMATTAAIGVALNEGDRTYAKRWLNDGDNAAFRTFEGRA